MIIRNFLTYATLKLCSHGSTTTVYKMEINSVEDIVNITAKNDATLKRIITFHNSALTICSLTAFPDLIKYSLQTQHFLIFS